MREAVDITYGAPPCTRRKKVTDKDARNEEKMSHLFCKAELRVVSWQSG